MIILDTCLSNIKIDVLEAMINLFVSTTRAFGLSKNHSLASISLLRKRCTKISYETELNFHQLISLNIYKYINRLKQQPSTRMV